MRWYADLGELHHQVFADAIVKDALAGDGAALLIVEGGGVILEILDEPCRARGLRRGPWRCPRRLACVRDIRKPAAAQRSIAKARRARHADDVVPSLAAGVMRGESELGAF